MSGETLDYLTLEEKFNLQESVFVFSVPELVKGSKEEFRDPGIDLITKLKKSGVKVLTPRDIDFSKLKSDAERVKLREKLGGIFIIPSAEMMKENEDLVKFLFEVNIGNIGGVDRTIFFLTEHSQAKPLGYLSEYRESIVVMSLVGDEDYDSYPRVRIAGQEKFTKFVNFYKEKCLQNR